MRNRETDYDIGMLDDEEEKEVPGLSFPRLAYIKVIGLDQARKMGLVVPSEIQLPADVRLYALHSADGSPLGITDSWEGAWAAALQNDFVPMSVH